MCAFKVIESRTKFCHGTTIIWLSANSIRKSFYIGKNIFPKSLKYHLAFCLNMSCSMKISRQIKLFRPDASIKKWHELKTEHELHENSYFQWLQLISAIPEGWKFIIKETHESTTNLIIHDHHVIKGSRILTLDKLSSTEIYAILISKFQNKPSSNFYFENLFNDNDIDWATIYMLPRLATYNTYMRSFQYKLLNNVLFLNKKLHIFGIKSSPLCSFCNLCEETPLHIFYECDSIKCLWSDLVHYFQNSLVLPILTPQTAIFGFLDSTNSDYNFKKNKLLINHIILIFKLYVYRSRKKQFIYINNLIAEIKSAKVIEKEIAASNSQKTAAFKNKWHITNDTI